MIDKEFINRCKSEDFQKLVKDFCKEMIYRSNKWQRENPDKQRKCIKKYQKTEKGKVAVEKGRELRIHRFKEACKQRDWREKKLIGNFYKNCPEGYEVDHIIPISRGGKHILSNLQYLTRVENSRKGCKLDWKKE